MDAATAAAGPTGARSVTRDPLALLAGLGVVGAGGFGLYLAGIPLHPAQQITAAACLLLWLAAVVVAPVNGLILLYLVPPLFNGEDGRPYFFLFEALVSLTIVAGCATRLWRRRRPVVPAAPFVALFLLSTLLSFPLNLQETWLALSVASWREIGEDIRRSDLAGNLFYIRTVLNVASGLALFVLAASEHWSRERLVRLATATTLVYAAVSLLGLWHYWLPVPPGKFMTVAYGWTAMTGGFMGLGFNVSYFAQYALAYLPLSALLLLEGPPGWRTGVSLLALGLTPYTILSTGQKAAYIVFAGELGLLLLVGLSLSKAAGRRAGVTLAAVVASLVAAVAALLVVTPLGSLVAARFHALWAHGDSYRVQSLGAAWQMFRDHPVLGVGAGRFARMFAAYDPDPAMQFGSLSAHNLYAQLLAEQGLLGLSSFLALLAVTLGPVIRARRQLGSERIAVLVLLVSLGAWLTYGLFQFTFLMRSMQVYFWITLGLVAALPSPAMPAPRGRSRRVAAAVLAAVMAVAGFRAYTALATPLPAGVAVGVYAEEPGPVRWTRSGAAFVAVVRGRVLQLSVACPLVPVGGVQTVNLWLDGVPASPLVLNAPGWQTVEIPVGKPVGSQVVLRLKTAYTITPAERGLSADHRRLGVLVQPIRWADR